MSPVERPSIVVDYWLCTDETAAKGQAGGEIKRDVGEGKIFGDLAERVY